MPWIRHPGTALEAFVDDELDPVRRARVATHLDRCPRCRHQVALTSRVRSSLRAMAQRSVAR